MENMRNVNNKDIESYFKFKRNAYIFFKRVMDIIVSSVGLTITFPIIMLFSILVMIESPGKPLYIQERVGKNGKEFNIFKIRSMYIDAEKDGAQWADKNDARITKTGNFIRKTRIDELPQFYNIFIGNMSLIGPRPERSFFIRKFEKKIPNFCERLTVKPGLTGWAQVNGGYEICPEEKLMLDLYYIKHQSFKLDLKIVYKTFFVLLSGDGAR